MKGRIVDVEFKAVNAVYLMQGIKRKDQWKYDGHLPGGNGTYVTGGEYSSSIIFKIYVYDLEHCISIDVKDEVLRLNRRKRVSDLMIHQLQINNKGKKIRLLLEDGRVAVPYSELNLLL